MAAYIIAEADTALADFAAATAYRSPRRRRVRERWLEHRDVGAIGVTGSSAANDLAAEADLILAIGTRLADFTTGSRSLFAQRRAHPTQRRGVDAAKHGAMPWSATRASASRCSSGARRVACARPAGRARAAAREPWHATVTAGTARRDRAALPSDAQVIGAVIARSARTTWSSARPADCRASSQAVAAQAPGGYHVEYGYSCMGYEIAGGLGAKLAMPDARRLVLIGDGST